MSGQRLEADSRRANVYEVLRNVRRRYVIYVLKSRDEPVEVIELVDLIAGWESARTNDEPPESRRRSVRNALLQTHLPKLDRHGFVEFDGRQQIVRPTDRLETIEVYPASQSVEWSSYFVVLSGLTFVLAGVDEVIGPPGPLGSLPWEPLALGGFVALAFAFAYDRYRWRRRFKRDGPDIVIDPATP